MNPQNLNRWWRTHRNEFGLQNIVLHQLRHTYLTMLVHTGADLEAIKRIAGWSDFSPMKTYLHDDDESKISAVAALSEKIAETKVARMIKIS